MYFLILTQAILHTLWTLGFLPISFWIYVYIYLIHLVIQRGCDFFQSDIHSPSTHLQECNTARPPKSAEFYRTCPIGLKVIRVRNNSPSDCIILIMLENQAQKIPCNRKECVLPAQAVIDMLRQHMFNSRWFFCQRVSVTWFAAQTTFESSVSGITRWGSLLLHFVCLVCKVELFRCDRPICIPCFPSCGIHMRFKCKELVPWLWNISRFVYEIIFLL